MLPLPSRQVHLDFHTSEHIPGVGGRFRKKQFQQALKLGGLNSITVFAKCHHSWSYYPTKIGRVHPSLTIDLLGGQIAACHEIGVRAPIYYTIGWSANDAEQHPEWLAVGRDGGPILTNLDLHAKPTDPRPICSWKRLCPNIPGYRTLILDQTREICTLYPVDGFFYDICHCGACYCPACMAGMKARGLDPASDADGRGYHDLMWADFMREANAVLHAQHPEATVFYNSWAELERPAAGLALETHFELEDLPTTWGGYDKFPLRAKFFLCSDTPGIKDKPILAMSGKFHTMWGEFGGYKHPDAIRFEAAAMIAFGARCTFGDQAHPSGEMDLPTYRNIGAAYRYVKKIEQYGLDGRPHSNLGVYLCDPPHVQGVCNMLLETQTDFGVVTPDSDLSRHDTIILPGAPGLTDAGAAKLAAFVESGGGLVVLYEGALDKATGRFWLDIGVDYLGPAKYELDYLCVGKELARGLPAAPFLNYTAAIRTRPSPGGRGAKVLATIREPYFDRTYARYCSHQNTPYQLEDAAHHPGAGAGAVQRGRVMYLAHPLGAIYHQHGARVHRDFFINALRRIYRRPILRAPMPSAGRVNLLHQPQHGRYVVHLLYGPPLQRGRCSVIEDLVPVFDVPVSLRVPEKVQRAVLPLSRKRLALRRTAGAVIVTVPRVQGHAMVVFEY